MHPFPRAAVTGTRARCRNTPPLSRAPSPRWGVSRAEPPRLWCRVAPYPSASGVPRLIARHPSLCLPRDLMSPVGLYPSSSQDVSCRTSVGPHLVGPRTPAKVLFPKKFNPQARRLSSAPTGCKNSPLGRISWNSPSPAGEAGVGIGGLCVLTGSR